MEDAKCSTVTFKPADWIQKRKPQVPTDKNRKGIIATFYFLFFFPQWRSPPQGLFSTKMSLGRVPLSGQSLPRPSSTGLTTTIDSSGECPTSLERLGTNPPKGMPSVLHHRRSSTSTSPPVSCATIPQPALCRLPPHLFRWNSASVKPSVPLNN